jgi:hypothetical protein
MSCKHCWSLICPRTRNLLKALIYKGATDATKKQILKLAQEELHPKLEAALDKRVRTSTYTVVPYNGVRKRKPVSKKSSYTRYLKYLNDKYYGGPWEGQK